MKLNIIVFHKFHLECGFLKIRFNSIKDFTSHLSKFENISYLFGHIFKKEFSQNMGNVGLTILK